MSDYYLLGNYVLSVAMFAWFLAQLIKFLLYRFKNKKFKSERIWGSGGMPSAHSALVSSMTVAVARIEGMSSSLFAIAFLNAAIVMYDAMGVRRSAGEQAKVLNQFLRNHPEEKEAIESNLERPIHEGLPNEPNQLKEVMGHTPLEVFCGIILGVLVAFLLPVN